MLGKGIGGPVGLTTCVVRCLQWGARMRQWWGIGVVRNACSIGAEARGAANFVRSVR